jgi:hypothetical protein
MPGLESGNLQGLTEAHRFVLLLLIQAGSLLGTWLLYRSAPHKKGILKDDDVGKPGPDG